MKICPVCGKSCEDKARFCTECGSRFPVLEAVVEPAVPTRAVEEPAVEEPVVPAAAPVEPAVSARAVEEPAPAPAPVYAESVPSVGTKKEFLKLPENKRLKKNLNASAIICYVSAALTLAVTLPTGYIDVMTILAILLTVAAGVLLQVKQSRVAAIALLAFAVINTVYSMIVLGQPAGWLLILAGVFAVLNTFQLEKLWTKYRAERGV